ncbi:YbaB/EbfC family nucleoid-associated protein [Nocardia neocaledoniensis]|uniref:YbaB/EbfC family nucleoid-associated protein n=1 Tax=Nocardia neocaledoniensis TaxID=236511 RepID=UPI002453F6C2|nr:YbaB/EbfC family nucleoid-associated protein [Nocardia neocaledoniensis]
MTEDWSAPTRAANAALRAQIDGMLESFDAEKSALIEAQARATELVTVWSADGLVRVSGTVAGVSEVHIEPDAFKRSTPDSLGRSVTAAITELAARAALAQQEALAPLTADVPDLPDLIPGVPSMKDLIARLTPPPPPTPDPVAEAPRGLVEDSDDEEGDYFRNRSYLR